MSKRDIPHFYVRRTVRLGELLTLRSQLNAASPVRISINDFMIKAIAVAHIDIPDMNVTWTDEAMRKYETVDVAVAVATDRGLVTPVVRGVERSTLSSVAAQVRMFVDQAAAGRLRQGDLEGGSITVSNLGMHGVDEFAAIINPPQSAILAVGAVRPSPTVTDGVVAVADTVDLVLSVDHRAIDGALAAEWIAALATALATALENPARLVV